MERFSVSLLAAILSLSPLGSTTVQAAPAQTFQPGFWQPIQRVDPARSIQVEIQNQTGLVLEYGLTSPKDDVKELAPRQQTRLSLTDLPVYLTINTIERTALRYDLKVESNRIRLVVRRINDVSGDRTLNINETGAIYIY